MKTGIIHFTDIHIRSGSDLIIRRKDAVAKACKSAVVECTKVIVVITGDLAFSGAIEEYEVVYDFLKYIENAIMNENFIEEYEYVIVPGNHDCDFRETDNARKILLNAIRKDDCIVDNDIMSICLKPQKAFWEFYKRLLGDVPTPSISFAHKIPLEGTISIYFNCYNTSFMSEKDEKYGSLIIPEECFLDCSSIKKSDDIVISILHHNTGWLSPNTKNNNKRRFEQHLSNTSNIIMCGHEHESNEKSIIDLSQNTEITYLEGSALQNGKESCFSVYVYGTTEDKIYVKGYKYSNDYYSLVGEREMAIKKRNIDGLFLNDEFYNSLNKIEIPIKHPKKQNLVLDDIFVWQDVEEINDSVVQGYQYKDSYNIIVEQPLNGVVFIEGESQTGKTSLLKMAFQALNNVGVYSIMINGEEILHPNIHPLLKQSYKRQYQYGTYKYDKYTQLEKSKKVILIDDFERSLLNNEGKVALFEKLLSEFKAIIVMSTPQNDVKSYLLQNRKETDIKRYNLLTLGYEKRNALIEKWIRLGTDKYTIDEATIAQEVKLTFDQVTNLVGEQFIPTFPIFILSLLQGLNPAFKQFDVTQTSYAFCYKSLIIASLWRSGVKSDKINGILNFLKEFAYRLFERKESRFTKGDFYAFYNRYVNTYHTSFTAEKLMEILCDSNIFKIIETQVCFSYRYIFYYLIATKISMVDDKTVIDSVVSDLCATIHEEQSANILIFLIHHIGNNKAVIDSLLFTCMLPFENSPMATLDTQDSLFKNLSELIEEIKSEVLLDSSNPKEERAKALKASDKTQRENDDRAKSFELNEDPLIRNINNAYKIVRILGQIVKNQNETFEMSRLVDIIEETYKASFRVIGFYTQMIVSVKDEIVSFLLSENNKTGRNNDYDFGNRVSKLLQFMLYRSVLSIFSNLAFSVGSPDMRQIYDDVANKIGSPAAKIVSFTINSYYNKMAISDLESLVWEFKDNPVVLEIIKARVIRYVYNNNVEYNVRQRIGSICNLKLVNTAEMNRLLSKQNEI